MGEGGFLLSLVRDADAVCGNRWQGPGQRFISRCFPERSDCHSPSGPRSPCAADEPGGRSGLGPIRRERGRGGVRSGHSLYSRKDGECGCSATCPACPIRRAVTTTYETGEPQSDIEVTMSLQPDSPQSNTPKDLIYRISTSLIRLPLSASVLMCIEDITARKRAEQDLQAAFTEIERLKNRLERENVSLREEVQLHHQHEEIVGNSAAIRAVMAQVEQVADTPAAVLLMGETGTGKELFARSVHKLSARKDAAMVAVNCAALPATLIESELFGREAGAYTGALSKQIGRFEMADGSTLFLDEIGELSLELQAKLLRILQDGQFERLGSSKTISVDVRIVAATNRDLAQAIKDGEFREDLYHRLNVFPIAIPPLRERTEDIPLLVWAFVKELGARMGKAVDAIPRRVMEGMQRYPWPGNVRELRNVVERAMILARDPRCRPKFPPSPGLLRHPCKRWHKSSSSTSCRCLNGPDGAFEGPTERLKSSISNPRRSSHEWPSSESNGVVRTPIMRRISIMSEISESCCHCLSHQHLIPKVFQSTSFTAIPSAHRFVACRLHSQVGKP